MENASKALLMAGSILITVIIVSMLTFTYTSISNMQQEQADRDAVLKTIDYMADFEQFNQEYIYGSELLSLGNLQDNYNRTQAGTAGYSNISIKVILTKQIDDGNGTVYLRASNKEVDIEDIMNCIARGNSGSIEDKIKNYENTTYGTTGKTIKYLSKYTMRELASMLGISYRSDDDDFALEAKIMSTRYGKDMLKEITEYKNLKSAYTEFKNTEFECLGIQYDALGRITEMKYQER